MRLFINIFKISRITIICCTISAIILGCQKEDKGELFFNIGGYPVYSTLSSSSTKAIGTLDEGKTLWSVGDKIFLLGEGQVVTIKCTQADKEVLPGENQHTVWALEDGENIPNSISEAIYAPCYAVNSRNNGLELKDGFTGAEYEYITTLNVDITNGIINIHFDSIRGYSRFRVVTIPNAVIQMKVVEGRFYTPNGDDIANKYINSSEADINGNAFLYGKWSEGTKVQFRYTNSTDKYKEIEKTLPNPITTQNKSYTFMLVPETLNEGASNEFASAGNGNENSPYLIYTQSQMSKFLSLSSSIHDRHYKLMSDIVFEPTDGIYGSNFYPAVYSNMVFDGNNKTISNLKHSASHDIGIGLFKELSNSTIKNLILSNIILGGQRNMGGIVYEGESVTLENCHIKGISITCKEEGNGGEIGGLIGSVSGNSSILNCSVSKQGENGKMICKSSHDSTNGIGGLIGIVNSYSTVNVNSCKVDGISIDGYYKIGGIIGFVASNVNSISVNNCEVNATIGSHKTENYVAGLCGYDVGSDTSNTHSYINNTVNSSWCSAPTSCTNKNDFVNININKKSCYKIEQNSLKN